MRSVLHDEILSQASVIEGLLASESENIRTIAERFAKRRPPFIFLVARGSSDNAALYAKYLFGVKNGIVCAMAAPSIITAYRTLPEMRGALVLALSQSGQSEDLIEVVSEARRRGGAETLTVTNEPDSPLAKAAHMAVNCRAGVEKSIAATKSYTAELAALALLSAHMRGDAEMLAEIARLPGAIRAALACEGDIEAAAGGFSRLERCAVIGRGFNYATAFEIALKMKELAAVTAEPYSSADFRHGPIAMVRRGYVAIFISPRWSAMRDLLVLRSEMVGKRARVIDITNLKKPAGSSLYLSFPDNVPEWLSPVTAVVPGQLLAYYLAKAKRRNPDRPHGLSKVTSTR